MFLDQDELHDYLKDNLRIRIESRVSHPLYGGGQAPEIIVQLVLAGEIISEDALPIG